MFYEDENVDLFQNATFSKKDKKKEYFYSSMRRKPDCLFSVNL